MKMSKEYSYLKRPYGLSWTLNFAGKTKLDISNAAKVQVQQSIRVCREYKTMRDKREYVIFDFECNKCRNQKKL